MAAALACGHEGRRFGSALCSHLRTCRTPWLPYFHWYIGSALAMELLCLPCAEARGSGEATSVDWVCEECFTYAATEIGDLQGNRGKPEILERLGPCNTALSTTSFPAE